MTSWIWIVFVVLFVIAVWEALFIWLWIKGLREKNSTLTIIGGLFSLGFIGLIIALVQVSNWNTSVHHHSGLEIEREKLALEREKLELEKLKHENDKKKKS